MKPSPVKPPKFCIDCGVVIFGASKRCLDCKILAIDIQQKRRKPLTNQEKLESYQVAIEV